MEFFCIEGRFVCDDPSPYCVRCTEFDSICDFSIVYKDGVFRVDRNNVGTDLVSTFDMNSLIKFINEQYEAAGRLCVATKPFVVGKKQYKLSLGS